MPRYDYLCPANGRVIEATHRMSESLATWGDLCRVTGIDLDDTDPAAPVTREWVLPNIVSHRLGAETARHAANCSCCSGGETRRGPLDFGSI